MRSGAGLWTTPTELYARRGNLFRTEPLSAHSGAGEIIHTTEVVPESFAGLYRFLEDGWRGRLLLWHDTGRRLVGRFRTDRYTGEFGVVAEVDEEIGHQVRITIADFNEMPEQSFVGYMLRADGNVMTGVTFAEGTAFGFCARRTRSLVLTSFRPGDVRPGDFAGVFTMRQEFGHGTVRLEYDGGRDLHGSFQPWEAAAALPVQARVDDTVPHGLRLSFDGETVATGYLSTRPKNMIAGMVVRGGVPFAFYMVKLTDLPGPASAGPAG